MKISDRWGIRFSEHMGGYFSPGVADPVEGLKRGKGEKNAVDFWVCINIPSLKRFAEEPDYAAAMDGKVSIGQIGNKLHLEKGLFNIFPGEPGSGMRHITYRFGFKSDANEQFYFSGVKNIHEDRSLRKREEPITLYSKIYRGDSENGELYAAGVLTFNVLTEGLKFFLSFRYPGARSLGEKMRALQALSRMTTP